MLQSLRTNVQSEAQFNHMDEKLAVEQLLKM